MPTTYAIPNGRTVMDATLYTGNSTGQAIINTDLGTTGFQPDLVWLKSRSGAYSHRLVDSVRGTSLSIFSNSTSAETSESSVTAFNTNGFTVGTNGSCNLSGDTFVGWQWKAGGTAVSNTSGTITSSVSANTTSGFSIVTYTGTGANATVGHGLGVAPALIIIKSRSAVTSWGVYFGDPTRYLLLDTTAAAVTSSTFWNNTAPTSSVINLGSASTVNFSGATYVAYCWTPIAGFSSMGGSYTGNGSTDGPFIYTGFRPKFILLRDLSNVNNWQILDASRNTYNVANSILQTNLLDAESAFGVGGVDFLSNGFKLRTSSTSINTTSAVVIYAAFAENPFKYANAR